MSNNRTYRIVEHLGKFTIQVSVNEVSGCLWWKSIKQKWVRANTYGYPLNPEFYIPKTSTFLEAFNSLEEAKQKIKDWNTAPVYHNL